MLCGFDVMFKYVYRLNKRLSYASHSSSITTIVFSRNKPVKSIM